MSVAPVSGALPAALVASSLPTGTVGTATAASTGGGASPTGASAAARAANQFERVLLEQLTKQLSATAAPEDDAGSAATSAYRDMLPGTMAEALAAAGGIGIAAQLTSAMTGAAAGPPSPAAATAGTATAAAPAPTAPTPQTGTRS